MGPLLGDPVAAWDAISALRRYSLVTPAGDGLVLVHRLVQAVTISHMAADLVGGWRQAAATLVEAAIPEDTRNPGTWPACALLLPHAQVALAEASYGVARLAEYLHATDNGLAAADLWRGIADAREQTLGPEHPDTLTAQHKLAFVDSWDFGASYGKLAALLPICERVLGTEHPRPWLSVMTSPFSQDGWATRPPPGTCSPHCCLSGSGPRPRAPRYPEHPERSRKVNWGCGRPGRRPGPVCCRYCLRGRGSSAQTIRTL